MKIKSTIVANLFVFEDLVIFAIKSVFVSIVFKIVGKNIQNWYTSPFKDEYCYNEWAVDF